MLRVKLKLQSIVEGDRHIKITQNRREFRRRKIQIKCYSYHSAHVIVETFKYALVRYFYENLLLRARSYFETQLPHLLCQWGANSYVNINVNCVLVFVLLFYCWPKLTNGLMILFSSSLCVFVHCLFSCSSSLRKEIRELNFVKRNIKKCKAN